MLGLLLNLRTLHVKHYPCQRDDDAVVGVVDQAMGDAMSTRLSTGLAPAWLTLRAGRRLFERGLSLIHI